MVWIAELYFSEFRGRKSQVWCRHGRSWWGPPPGYVCTQALRERERSPVSSLCYESINPKTGVAPPWHSPNLITPEGSTSRYRHVGISVSTCAFEGTAFSAEWRSVTAAFILWCTCVCVLIRIWLHTQWINKGPPALYLLEVYHIFLYFLNRNEEEYILLSYYYSTDCFTLLRTWLIKTIYWILSILRTSYGLWYLTFLTILG